MNLKVSRPAKSISCSGPRGWPHPSLNAVSISSAVASPVKWKDSVVPLLQVCELSTNQTSFQHPDSFSREGNENSIDNESWFIFGCNRNFAKRFGPRHYLTELLKCFISSRIIWHHKYLYVWSEVCGTRTTSTNFNMGTGLKKCKPTTRSLISTGSATSLIRNDEVLDATITSSSTA